MPKLNLNPKSRVIAMLFCFAFIFTSGCLAPKTKPTTFPAADKTNDKTDRITLDNGLTLLMRTLPRSDIVSIVVLIKAGSSNESRFLGSGISHLTEHMLFKDNPEDPKSEIARQVSLLGGDINGFTGYDWTEYLITLPKENIVKGLELFHTFLMKPEFRKKDLEKEKQVVLKEINLNKDNPSRVLWDKLMEAAFTRHPYRYPIIGYENLLKNISLEDIKEYYSYNYSPQNIIVSLAGNFDKVTVRQKIDELFAEDKVSKILPVYKAEEPEQLSTRKIIHRIKSTDIAFGALAYKSVSMREKDMFALDALAFILGGSNSSRLNQRLKEDLKIVYSISASDYTPTDPGLLTITFRGETKNLESSFREISREIEKIKKSGVSQAELDRTKQAVKADFLFSQENCQDLAGLNAQFEAIVSNPDFNTQYLEHIDKLTRKDIQDAANKYLKDSSLTTVSLIPDTRENISAGIKESVIEKPEIKRYVLDGGLRALLKKDSYLPTVDIKIIFLGGILSETEKNNGITYLTSELLLKGAKGKTAFDISRAFESWGASVSAFSGSNSFGISAKVLKEKFPEALKLISEIITSPAFDQNEIDKEKTIILAQLKEQKENIFTIGSLLLKKELYQNHPYSFNLLGTPATIKNITRKDIMDFHAKNVNKANMVISIFGDIEPKEAVGLINRDFSALVSKGSGGLISGEPKPLSRNNSIFEILQKEQSLYMLGFRTCNLKNQDKYALELVSEVLSGLDGRLFKNIRKKLGIAYALGAYNSELLRGGHFVFYIATTKENLTKAQEKIWQEIKALKKHSVTPEELNRAKKSLIGKQKIGLETNSALGLRVAIDELLGLGFDNYKNFEPNINSLSREKIKQVLNKYLTDNFSEVFISPSSFISRYPDGKFSLKKLFRSRN